MDITSYTIMRKSESVALEICMNVETYDWLACGFFIVSAAVLFYQSWTNIIHKKLTGFSFDALMLIYLRKLRGKNSVANANRSFEKEPKRIQTLGIFAFCGALAAIYLAIDWYLLYIH